ncbi:phosphoglycolate phosphatase [Paraglaciecola sp.]|uniref:phosphoglycolate phosphatase n=1 Tax=Paraglaciecola sp. TaxID=1920173 RepID=UPI00273D8046|nr:phosphoglycolate phosphatase [Paraglaciecola sp.]MDP5029633.1 phosphoglycolate phosphatase [Paraglaciecola sp.]
MKLSDIELVVFDLDGTLIDSVPDLAIATNQTLQVLGQPSVSETQVRDFVGNGADTLLARALSQNIIVKPELAPELCLRARQLFDEFYAQTEHKSSKLYPTVSTTLAALHQAGINMALLTNKPSQFLPAILTQQNIAYCFVDIIGGDTFARKKPDPMALAWLLNKYQLKSKQVLMVGDSKHDIETAKNAGCRSFGLSYGYNHGESIALSRPDFVAQQLDELLEILGLVGEHG